MYNPEFSRLDKEVKAAFNGATGVCSIITWSAITGDDVETAQYILETYAGRKPAYWDSSHPRCGWDGIKDAFKAMGYAMEPAWFEAKTVTTLAREKRLQSGKYVVATSGGAHMFAMIDGEIIDWTAGRRHRIANVWAITKL